ncbi:MAG: FxDxF family PEP-CTERM protein [Pseudomonadota bacterium]
MFKRIAAISYVCALLAAPCASAAVLDLSNAEAILVEPANGIVFGTSFANGLQDSYFNNRYTFTLASNALIEMQLTTSYVSSAATIQLSAMSLYDNNNHMIAAGLQDLTGKKNRWNLTINELASGSYYLLVSGKLLTNRGASYAADGTVTTVAPVPEPSTYAMLLGGLAIVAYAARRRNARAGTDTTMRAHHA